MLALGVSVTYAVAIRAGRRRPRPGHWERERNLSRAYGRLLVLLARMQNKSPEAIAAKLEGSGYRPDLIIGMRTGNIEPSEHVTCSPYKPPLLQGRGVIEIYSAWEPLAMRSRPRLSSP
jgi:hypothetical protein